MNKRSQLTGLHSDMKNYVDGDVHAFSRLYAALTPRLRRLLYRFVHNETIVDDLLQLTMLKAHLAREHFSIRSDHPDAAVQAWYFTIARHVAMDYLRKEHRHPRQFETSGHDGSEPAWIETIPDPQPSLEELHVSQNLEQEIIQRVQQAIAQLPESQREIVELHKLQGKSMSEIAERLQIHEGAVRVRAHRAYRALARWLGVS